MHVSLSTVAIWLVDKGFHSSYLFSDKENRSERLEASTSQSAHTIFFSLDNSTAKDAVMLLFPTPPFPDNIVIEIVYESDTFKPIKKSIDVKVESYKFEISDNPFDRGEIIGGFYAWFQNKSYKTWKD